MAPAQVQSGCAALVRLPKAELHLHLEGCLFPMQVVQLAARHGEKLRYGEVAARYHTNSFPAFLELFKWATSYLRDPADYALLCENSGLHFLGENCLYAEITLSVGVMLLRKQNVEANFSAIRDAMARYTKSRDANSPALRVNWIFDAVRQFGPEKAMDVVRLAAQMKSAGVVAFGLGGDEESLPASDFRKVFDYAASEGLHRVAHAGEMAGPQNVRDAIELLGAERIGHGIAAIHDEALMDLLIERQIPLEICPTSNLRTGALSKLLGIAEPRIEDHPLPKFIARGVPVTLASDDPAMFRTSLLAEYTLALAKMGLTLPQLVSLAEASFRHSFLPATEKEAMLETFRNETKNFNLI